MKMSPSQATMMHMPKDTFRQRKNQIESFSINVLK